MLSWCFPRGFLVLSSWFSSAFLVRFGAFLVLSWCLFRCWSDDFLVRFLVLFWRFFSPGAFSRVFSAVCLVFCSGLSGAFSGAFCNAFLVLFWRFSDDAFLVKNKKTRALFFAAGGRRGASHAFPFRVTAGWTCGLSLRNCNLRVYFEHFVRAAGCSRFSKAAGGHLKLISPFVWCLGPPVRISQEHGIGYHATSRLLFWRNMRPACRICFRRKVFCAPGPNMSPRRQTLSNSFLQDTGDGRRFVSSPGSISLSKPL